MVTRITAFESSHANAPGADASLRPLDALADRIDSDQAAAVVAAVPPEQAAQLAEAEKQFKVLLDNLGGIVAGGLKALRAGLARKLPELRNEWTDDSLEAFAGAVPPVLMKRMGALGPLMGAYPEETILAMMAVPLALGFVNAKAAHAEATARVIEAPRPAAAPAAPAPTGTPVHRVG